MVDRFSQLNREHKFLILFSVLFLLIFLIVFGSESYFINSYKEAGAGLKTITLYSLTVTIVPVLLVPLIKWFSEKLPLLGGWQNVVLHIVINFAYIFLFIVLLQTLLMRFEGYNIFEENLNYLISALRRQLIISGSMAFLLYWGIVVFYSIQKYFNDTVELINKTNMMKSQLSKAKLSTLKAQLKPHFLFNTLSLVDYLIQTDPEKAKSTITKLEDLLKGTFDQNQSNTCTIRDEISFINKYLDIEKERFGERLEVLIHLEEETLNKCIPCYLIQPLVENSIKHGVGKSLGQCTISIRSVIDDNVMKIEVMDNGSGYSKQPSKSEWGVGLKNIEERLKIYFGEDAFMSTDGETQGGFKTSINIPTKYFDEQ